MKILYQGLGHKLAFGKWALIVHTTKKVHIQSITKALYLTLLAAGYAEEA